MVSSQTWKCRYGKPFHTIVLPALREIYLPIHVLLNSVVKLNSYVVTTE